MSPSFLHEPLFHFLLLGGLLFGLDYWLTPTAAPEQTIVLEPETLNALAGNFTQARGRTPTQEELSELAVRWLTDEVLVREARELKLAQGDDVIRNRLASQMRAVVQHQNSLGEPSRDELERFFQAHQNNYDIPAHYDLEQRFVAGGVSEAELLAAQWREQIAPAQWPQATTSLRHRPASNIVAIYGEPASDALLREPYHWQAVATQRGAQVARVTRVYPAQSAEFEAVRPRVARDWRLAEQQRRIAAEVARMAQGYRISVPPEVPQAAVDAIAHAVKSEDAR
ncbi:peptidyl-prolyl cis-trans isomerase [Teredinibacter turnerae]|uniref:peptidylprolyl isomerase n=1 Tax=Teredinibacter turnerae TaxID=2426 RepID=UPI000366B8A5|nr:peptidylprolyl isomerase [Teredinibacter turnerae]